MNSASLRFIPKQDMERLGYGAYLNKTDENQIELRMEERKIPLQGARAKFRNLQPIFVLDAINLNSDEMADAVALIDGRIENIFVKKNIQQQFWGCV